jgi:hypothetical protein
VPADIESCQSCGATPAIRVEFIALVHVLFWFQIERDKATRCRDCALALYRRHVSMILILGWWGLAQSWEYHSVSGETNEHQRALEQVQRLGPPRQTTVRFTVGKDHTIADAGPATHPGRSCNPLDAGRPLRKRISSYLIVYALVALIVVIVVNHVN